MVPEAAGHRQGPCPYPASAESGKMSSPGTAPERRARGEERASQARSRAETPSVKAPARRFSRSEVLSVRREKTRELPGVPSEIFLFPREESTQISCPFHGTLLAGSPHGPRGPPSLRTARSDERPEERSLFSSPDRFRSRFRKSLPDSVPKSAGQGVRSKWVHSSGLPEVEIRPFPFLSGSAARGPCQG